MIARLPRRASLAILALLAPLVTGAAPPLRDGYQLAVPPYRFEFPRDHAAHPEFRTEWWYYTGHLAGAGRSLGYELTFFRVGLDRARRASPSAWAPHTLVFAHFALTDEDRRSFRFAERIDRPALGMAGADSARYHVWVGDWTAELGGDGVTHRLRAETADAALALELAPLKSPAIHGAGGVSAKSALPGAASHYYSLTRLATRGRVRIGSDTLGVVGTSWMDHEFGSSGLAPHQVGWDWFSVQLDDGRELMLYALRLDDGRIEPVSSGTWVEADGRTRHLPLAAFTIRPTGTWKSPHSGAEYPQGWGVRVPDLGVELTLTPSVADQELVTRATAGVVYWEGSVRVTGTDRGRPVRGAGYVELTGYTGASPGLR